MSQEVLDTMVYTAGFSLAAGPGALTRDDVKITNKSGKIWRLKKLIWTYRIFCLTNGNHYPWLEPGLFTTGYLEIILTGKAIARPFEEGVLFRDLGRIIEIHVPDTYEFDNVPISDQITIWLNIRNDDPAFTRQLQGGLTVFIDVLKE